MTEKETYYKNVAINAINAYLEANDMSPEDQLSDLDLTSDEFKEIMGYEL